MTCRQSEKRVDIPEFTGLSDSHRLPLRTYSTWMRVGPTLGGVTRPGREMLSLDEGIGAVDAAFLERDDAPRTYRWRRP